MVGVVGVVEGGAHFSSRGFPGWTHEQRGNLGSWKKARIEISWGIPGRTRERRGNMGPWEAGHRIENPWGIPGLCEP